jgi:asparagine synthase (glutamine-hydrolysing)
LLAVGERLAISLPRASSETSEQVSDDAVTMLWAGNASGSRMLTFEGRLDNRSELIGQLRHALPTGIATNDAQLIAAAYAAWGETALPRLIGDWSLAVWDRARRRVVLAVDYPGITRPLYYRVTQEGVLWSSELKTFLALDPALAVNEGYLIHHLTAKSPFGTSLFADVHRVCPGEKVVIAEGAVHRASHYAPSLEDRISYRRDEDYERHFRSLFSTAIADRLRGQRCVWSELSGGWDSSSIVCVADELLKQQESATQLHTITGIHEFPVDPIVDADTPYREAVTQKTGRTSHLFNAAAEPLMYPAADGSFLACPIMEYGYHRWLARALPDSGAHVLLSGQGGDHAMVSNPLNHPYLADLLVQGRWRKLLRRARAVSTARSRSFWTVLKDEAFRGALFDRRYQGEHEKLARRFCPWLNWSLVDSNAAQLQDSVLSTQDVLRALPSRRFLFAQFEHALHAVSPPQHRAVGPTDITYPFLDRRIIEFTLAIPVEQHAHPERARDLHRRALTGFLPDVLLARRRKKAFDAIAYRHLMERWGEVQALLADDSHLAKGGYVDLPRLRERAQAVRMGQVFEMGRFVRALAVECWLRQLEWERRRLRVPA